VLWGGDAGGLSVSLPRLRAPRDDGGILAEPPLEQVSQVLARNRRDLAAATADILGKPLAELRRLARANVWDAARRYHADAGEPIPRAPTDDQPWLIAGHQPDIFHPGVWFKNFAMKGLAERHGGFSLNLVIDNDAARAPVLHVPDGEHIARLPYDHWQGDAPYEERAVLDEALFGSLSERTFRYTREWPFQPLLPAYWREAMRQRERTPLLGERLAAARRIFERQWGCHQAEVPISRLCATEAFARFACYLVLNAGRLREAYNDAAHNYRRRHGLRSVFHPVPDLAAEGDWCEVPLWAWRRGQRQRARLFVRRSDNDVQLRAGPESWPSLSLHGDPERLTAEWQELEPRGYKVRTRALTTTLFARLLLGDAFIHGIGGGKYDELTDVLLARFFGCSVPGYLVLTATLLLPLPHYSASASSCRELARLHRDVYYNPQRHLSDGAVDGARALAEAKAWYIAQECTTHSERRERFVKLREVNAQMRPFVELEEARLRQACAACRYQVRANEVLGRRDYAFCLYPEELLEGFYRRCVDGTATP
jgi:hypothetical protein